MLCSPARKMSIWKPAPCQADSTAIDNIAVRGSPSQSGWGASSPSARSSHWLMSPASVCRIRPQTAETTTIDVTTGEKNTVRRTTRPRNGRFTPQRHAEGQCRLKWHHEQREKEGVGDGAQELRVACTDQPALATEREISEELVALEKRRLVAGGGALERAPLARRRLRRIGWRRHGPHGEQTHVVVGRLSIARRPAAAASRR